MASHLDLKEVRQTAQLRGGKCLSQEYIELYRPLKWMCKRGHTWDAPYSIIRQGGWCRQCVNIEKKEEQFEKLKAIAKEKGGRCLSSVYINGHTKIKLQCRRGHIWNARPYNVLLYKSWCYKCYHIRRAEESRNDISELVKIAESHGGKLLSKKYINNHSPLKWQCQNGHRWIAGAKGIKNKSTWCPQCGYSKTGKAITRPYSEIVKLALKQNVKLLTDEKHYVNMKTIVRWQCSKGHKWYAKFNTIKNKSTWCPQCAIISASEKRKAALIAIKKLAAQQGGKLLSEKYYNTKAKLKFQCVKGHIWTAAPSKIKGGSWCRICSRLKYDINKMQELAKGHDGKCLSTNYISITKKLKWYCANHHKFYMAPSLILSQNSWCPKCYEHKRGVHRRADIKEFQELAMRRGGKLLSNNYINSATKLKWQCDKGHVWVATPNNVKARMTWCPTCANRKRVLTRIKTTRRKMLA